MQNLTSLIPYGLSLVATGVSTALYYKAKDMIDKKLENYPKKEITTELQHQIDKLDCDKQSKESFAIYMQSLNSRLFNIEKLLGDLINKLK